MSPHKKVLIISDFDGTICTVDMGNEILNKFTDKNWDGIDRDYIKGKIGSRVAYKRISRILKGSREKMRDFVLAKEKLDPFFSQFYYLSKEKGIDVKIVSDGLDFYIQTILEKYGLGDIEYFSNSAVFSNDGSLVIEFPAMNELCGRCGTCKNHLLNSYRFKYDEIIYIGDGYSDFCPSKYADLVFAKRALLRRCEEDGTPCMPFNDFNEINNYLRKNY
jgi:2-hydroxy-3-keto-5-methylthiopentenyl-1-phosphate phosphatase